ncbi:MAG TPA: hypothetical protein VF765_06885 [Polyangiaceae bacterium]
MPVGRSGRIVVEFDPELKRQLHARLRSDGRDFKGWLLERVQEYLDAPRSSTESPREGREAAHPSKEPPPELSELGKRVLDAVSAEAPGGRHVDDLVQATGLGFGKLQGALLQLELQGVISQHLGRYRRV